MNYVDLTGFMTMEHIVEALDDNGDGAADAGAWNQVLAAADERIDNVFGGAVPEALAHSVGYARKIFCAEILFVRRGFSGEHNPFSKRANDQEARMRKLASGEDNAMANAGGSFVGTKAKISGTAGLIL